MVTGFVVLGLALAVGTLRLAFVMADENEAYWHADARSALTPLCELRATVLQPQSNGYRMRPPEVPLFFDAKRERDPSLRVLEGGSAIAVRVTGFHAAVLRIEALRDDDDVVLRAFMPARGSRNALGVAVEPLMKSLLEELSTSPREGDATRS